MKLRSASRLCLATAFAGTYSGAAMAQPSVDTRVEATGPSMEMVRSGVSLLAASYVPVVVVGATSGLGADRTLFVPVAGPWIDLTQRPGCAPATSCNTENTARVLLVTDGVFQGIGAITIVGGLLTTTRETTTVRQIAFRPTLHLSPAQLAGRGYGLVAWGAF